MIEWFTTCLQKWILYLIMFRVHKLSTNRFHANSKNLCRWTKNVLQWQSATRYMFLHPERLGEHLVSPSPFFTSIFADIKVISETKTLKHPIQPSFRLLNIILIGTFEVQKASSCLCIRSWIDTFFFWPQVPEAIRASRHVHSGDFISLFWHLMHFCST